VQAQADIYIHFILVFAYEYDAPRPDEWRAFQLAAARERSGRGRDLMTSSWMGCDGTLAVVQHAAAHGPTSVSLPPSRLFSLLSRHVHACTQGLQAFIACTRVYECKRCRRVGAVQACRRRTAFAHAFVHALLSHACRRACTLPARVYRGCGQYPVQWKADYVLVRFGFVQFVGITALLGISD
jgi:hypothetical protein